MSGCACRHEGRPGLYIMVFLILLSSCEAERKAGVLVNQCRASANAEAK
jgi:hypothetical protein